MNPQGLARRRWRTVGTLGAPLLVLYLLFMLLIAWARDAAAVLLAPGVTLAMLLAALVIAGTWFTTWLYVRWANRPLGQQPDRPCGGGPEV